jgi:hypothetical protein
VLRSRNSTPSSTFGSVIRWKSSRTSVTGGPSAASASASRTRNWRSAVRPRPGGRQCPGQRNAGSAQRRDEIGPEDSWPVVVLLQGQLGDRPGFRLGPHCQCHGLACPGRAGDHGQRAAPHAAGNERGDPRPRHQPGRAARYGDLGRQDRIAACSCRTSCSCGPRSGNVGRHRNTPSPYGCPSAGGWPVLPRNRGAAWDRIPRLVVKRQEGESRRARDTAGERRTSPASCRSRSLLRPVTLRGRATHPGRGAGDPPPRGPSSPSRRGAPASRHRAPGPPPARPLRRCPGGRTATGPRPVPRR